MLFFNYLYVIQNASKIFYLFSLIASQYNNKIFWQTIYIQMKAMILFVVLALLPFIFTQAEESTGCSKVNYTHNLLALTWMPEFCGPKKKCLNIWDQLWDGYSFTIHGFWPSTQNYSELQKCFQLAQDKQDQHDPFCFTSFEFNISQFKDEEQTELKKYWPQFKWNSENRKKEEEQKFWRKQWSKHGTCYLNLTLQQNSFLIDKQIFHQYFLKTAQKVKTLNLQLRLRYFQRKQNLSTLLNLSSSQYLAICSHYGLKQIRVCYSISAIPGEEKIINCPDSAFKAQNCGFPIVAASPPKRNQKQSSFSLSEDEDQRETDDESETQL